MPNNNNFIDTINELLRVNDYRGVASSLRNHTYDSDEDRDEAYKLAERYEEQADIEDKLLGSASPSQKAAYRFLSGGPKLTGDNEEDNYYTKPFGDAWTNMSDKDGNITLNTVVDGHEFIDDFCEMSGIPIDKFGEYGITRGKDGTISFTRDNPNKIAIFKGINGLVNRGASYSNQQVNEYYDLAGIGVPTPVADRVFVGKFFQNHKQVKAYQQLGAITNRANEEYAAIMATKEIQPEIMQTVVTGYMGEDDKQLQLAFSAGAMDLSTFKEARKLLEEKYNRMMQTTSLTQFEIWSMNDDNKGSHLLQEMTDNIQKAALDEEMKLALAEGRLHYAHASNGIDFGTMITIDPKYDKKGNPIEEHSAKRFFVKDLFRSQAENRLRDDTQIDAKLKYNKHALYQHTYRAKDGARLENWSNNTAEYVDNFGNRRLVGQGEILDIIDNDIIERRLIDYYKRAVLRDKNGRQYTEESYQVYGNDKDNVELLRQHINRKAIQVVAAKYGDPSSEYVKVKAMKLASDIMKEVIGNVDE